MDSTLIDSSEPLVDYQRSWGFQQMVNEQTYHRNYEILVAVTNERDDLRKANALYRDELALLRRKNDESEGRNKALSKQSQELGDQLQGTILSNKRLQEQSDLLSQESQKAMEASIQSSDAQFWEIKQKDVQISEYQEHVRAQADNLLRMETSANNQTLAYKNVQRQLKALEVESSQRIERLEDCLAIEEMENRMHEDRAQAAKTKYDMRLQKIGGFVLVEQESVQRRQDELQEFEGAKNIEIAEFDGSE